MTRKALTQNQIDEFRQSYCETAFTLYREHDFNAISMRGIAKEMGCSPMTAYRYFENKEEVFASLRAILFHRLADQLEGVAKPKASPDGTLIADAHLHYARAVGMAYAQFAFNEPHAYRLLYMVQLLPGITNPDVEKAQNRTKKVLARVTKHLIDSGEFSGEQYTIAHGFWGLIHGIVSLELANQIDESEVTMEFIENILNQFLGVNK